MKKAVEQEVRNLIKELKLNYSIKEFQDKVNWRNTFRYQTFSLDFIREFKNKLNIQEATRRKLIIKDELKADLKYWNYE